MLSQIKSQQEIEAMRQAGAILAAGLQLMKQAAKPGVSTKYLSEIAHRHILSKKAEPAFLGYPGSGGVPPYPEAACISINDAVVHEIPGEDKIIKEGDIVSFDLGVSCQGMITDGALTHIVGETTKIDQDLVSTTKKALYAGLKQVKNGCYISDIGAAIQEVLESNDLGVVRDLVGHGVGYGIHEDPNIPNFGRRGRGPRLKSGMTVAIEPMATLGDYKVYIDSDGWTVRTSDGSKAAHFEHTVLVTDQGYEILTALA